MTLQEALISLGDKPLNDSPYSAAIRAILLGTLGKKGVDITKDTPGYMVLSKIHALTNQAKKDMLLNYSMGVVRSTDLYKQTVLVVSAVMAIIAIAITMAVVYGDTTVSPVMADVLKELVKEFFSFVKFVLTEADPTPAQTPAA